MLKWFDYITSPSQTPRDYISQPHCHELKPDEATAVTNLVVQEVQNKVIEFENYKEQCRSMEILATKMPDYSWLMSSDHKPKKYLTMKEKFEVENACERLKSEEFIKTVNHFKARVKNATSRKEILDIFSMCAHEVLASRPRNVYVSDVLKKYTRSASSINAVSYSTGGFFGGEVQVGSKNEPRQPYSARTYYDSIV